METPVSSALHYVLLLREERQDRNMELFTLMFYSNPMTDQKYRKEYLDMMKQSQGKKREYKTDKDQLLRLKQQQEAGLDQMRKERGGG